MAYGHREFIVVIGASEGAALEMLDSIKTELEVNEHLAEDFPEMVYCFGRTDLWHACGRHTRPQLDHELFYRGGGLQGLCGYVS